MKAGWLALVIAASPMPAVAEGSRLISADRLYEWCAQEDLSCTSYLDGVIDGLLWIGTARYGFCAPDNLTSRQIILAF